MHKLLHTLKITFTNFKYPFCFEVPITKCGSMQLLMLYSAQEWLCGSTTPQPPLYLLSPQCHFIITSVLLLILIYKSIFSCIPL